MYKPTLILASIVCALLLLSGCAAKPAIPVDEGSVSPGGTITRGGTTTLALLGEPVQVGDPFPAVSLVDTHLKSVDISGPSGQVKVVSIVPSLDTQVCEQQTHILGEEGGKLPAGIRRVTISRDLPFAHARFADETGFNEILFLSDYRQADFGRATGLLVDQLYLLARGVMVVDRQGIIRYMQIVPELSHLPDMERAFAEAEALLAEQSRSN